MNRGRDIQEAMIAVLHAMQRAQVLSTETLQKWHDLDRELERFYVDTDEAFFARVREKTDQVYHRRPLTGVGPADEYRCAPVPAPFGSRKP